MPDDIDLRPLLGPDVLDQGFRPTCVAMAASAANEGLRSVHRTPAAHLAPEALWWRSTNAGLTSEDGMLLGDVGEALEGPGQPELQDWPYNPNLGAGTEQPPSALPAPPWNRAQMRMLELHHDGLETLLEAALRDRCPVILIVEVTDEFYRLDEAGILSVPDVRGYAGGYHAVVCVGAVTHPTRGRLLLIKNSWGAEWGLGGYAWLPLGYLVAFVVQAAVVLDVEGDSDD